MKCILGITTYNRKKYIGDLLDSFKPTCNKNYEWVVVINDDCSKDDTLTFLENYDFGCQSHIIKNDKRKGVSNGKNQIMKYAQEIGFDILFSTDDDNIFLREGWDDLYIKPITTTQYKHLGYYNPRWTGINKKIFSVGYNLGTASSVMDAMGNFYTITPDVLEKIGFMDIENMGLWGVEHLDYSLRCCREGFNHENAFLHPIDCHKYITMKTGSNYQSSMTPEELYNERLRNNEKRIIAQNRKTNFIEYK